MDEKEKDEKAVFSNREIEGIAKAIALADLAARSPKEKNPSIPMTKDKRYYQSLEKGLKEYKKTERRRKNLTRGF